MKVAIAFQLDPAVDADQRLLNIVRSLIYCVYRHIHDRDYRTALLAASEQRLLPADVAILVSKEYEDIFRRKDVAAYGQVCRTHFDRCHDKGCARKTGTVDAETWARDRVHVIHDYLTGEDKWDLTVKRQVTVEYDAYTLECHQQLIADAKARKGGLPFGLWKPRLSSVWETVCKCCPGYAAVADAASYKQEDLSLEIDKLNATRGSQSPSFNDRLNLYGERIRRCLDYGNF